MGEVYRAHDTRLGRDVAIKVLPASFSSDRDRLRRFENEARATSALNHPNLLTLHDIGAHDGAPYIVSELLEGQTLRERLALGALPPRKAVDYGTQIAKGLGAAHEKGIVHRDLKPENIFVTDDGRVKILDFGLAKSQPEDTSELPTRTHGTEAGVILGTVGYMSPEQVQGQLVDHRSDIFAFGAVLHEMLTGARAFHGTSAIETMHAILKEDPPEPSRISREVTPGLDRIVRRCLEKRAAERFQSARDLGFALGETTVDAPLPTNANVTASVSGRRSRPLRWVWAGIAGLALVAGIVALIGAWNPGDGRDPLLPSTSSVRIQSLAVLPFLNFSRDPEQEYFVDGMTVALITSLTSLHSLPVRSPNSAMSFKGTRKTLPQIARELNVDGFLQGSVERMGDRVRISVQLIEAATDTTVWAESYVRDLRDIFALQSEIAQMVASKVHAAVTPDERGRFARTRPVDPAVYELYLRGQFHARKATGPEIEQGIKYFEQAIEKDPNYAPAYSGLAGAYYLLSDAYKPPREVMPKAKKAALKALELDQNLADAHTALAAVHIFLEFDWAAAESELKRAIELNPGDALAHNYYGTLLTVALNRDDEGVDHSRIATELDPLSAQVRGDVGWINFMRRKYEASIAENLKAIEIEPRYGIAHGDLGYAYLAVGRKTEALAAAEEGPKVDASPLVLALSGGVYALAGEKQRARAVLSDVIATSKNRHVCAYEVAIIHIGLGDKDEAFRWLNKGFDNRSACMPFTKIDPRLDPLRSDPRYDDLIRRIGFPQ
jgi:serine/threonine protein kinase/tetratricopeptide (TPR) repeat protein